MHSPIASSTSYSAVTVVATGRMNEEDRIDLMRFLFMGPTSSLGDRGRENLGAVGDWFDDDSEVSVPELVADLDDSFLGLDTEEQGKEATAVEETVTDSAHGGDPIDQEQVIRLSEEVDSEEFEEEGECVLGEGGFGQVYTASLEGSSKVHAVKIIPKVGENKDQTFREQDLLRRLIGCPFFSQLEASWQSSLNYYIVTPVYPGNLRDEVEKTCGLTIDVAHFYIKQILAGIDYLHSNYILHRDIKLDNILLTEDGHVVICDFGLATFVLPDGRARRSFEEDPYQRLPGFYVENQSYCFGTPQSTAPEVVLGNAYGFPSDMWSLGVIIYEIITGRPPWNFEYETTTELYQAIMGTDPDFVPSEWSDDPSLCLIALRLLYKDPSRRPAIGELLFSHVFLEFGGWESVQDFSKPGPIKPGRLSRGEELKEFWPGYGSERDQVADTNSSFTFTGPVILQEIEDQRSSSSGFHPIRVLRKTKGQNVARVRPSLARINTSDIPPSIPQTESVPRISSSTSHGSIDIPEVEDLQVLPFEGHGGSPKMDNYPLENLFPSLANFYLDETIRPLPSPVLYEGAPLIVPRPLSEASSRLPSSEAISVHSFDRYFSSTDSLGDIATSTSTTPLAGLRAFGRSQSKGKQERYHVERKLFGWARGLWRRGFGGLMSKKIGGERDTAKWY